MKYNLQKILDYQNENVVYRFCNHNQQFTTKEAQDIFNETLKWIYLTAKAFDEKKPLELNITCIDEMWHNFILYTKDYNLFCYHFFDKYIDHQPLSKKFAEKFITMYKSDENDYLKYRENIISDSSRFVIENLGRETFIKWYFEFKKYDKILSNNNKLKIDYNEVLPDIEILNFKKYYEKGVFLEIGPGEGHNISMMSEIATHIDCIEKNKKYIKAIKEKNIINLELFEKDVLNFEFEKEKYDLINISFVLMFFSKEQIEYLKNKIYFSLKNKGLLFFKVFNCSEPYFVETVSKLNNNENTFFSKMTNSYVTYFDDELFNNFKKNYTPIKNSSVNKLDITHGEPHYHSYYEFIGQK